MECRLIINGFAKVYPFKYQHFKGNIYDGAELLAYINRFYKMTDKMRRAMQTNCYTVINSDGNKVHTIEVFKDRGHWVCKNSDPQVKELFGTDIIATPYEDIVNGAAVLTAISALNTDKIVYLRK